MAWNEISANAADNNDPKKDNSYYIKNRDPIGAFESVYELNDI